MQNIAVFGAGLSATSLIHYLLKHSENENWKINIIDKDLNLVEKKIDGHKNGIALSINIFDENELDKFVNEQVVCISLLPPSLHPIIAKSCIRCSKNLFTASYISPEIKELEKEILEKNLVFMCELGADPGIDHLSIVKIIEECKQKGGEIKSLKSMTGALIDEKYLDQNLLKYKFTWNPANVIEAGSSGGKYLENKKIVEIPYNKLYEKIKMVDVPNLGEFACYANRNSIEYLDIYNIEDIDSFERGTLRYKEFVGAWNIVVNLGITLSVNEYDTDKMNCDEILKKELDFETSFEEFLKNKFPEISAADLKTVLWLGLNTTDYLKKGLLKFKEVLLNILLVKLKFEDHDKDLLVMKHEIEYELKGNISKENATLILRGDNKEETAISKTVGLPLAIFTKLFLTKKINIPFGLHIPNLYDICNPILDELEDYNIKFNYSIEKS